MGNSVEAAAMIRQTAACENDQMQTLTNRHRTVRSETCYNVHSQNLHNTQQFNV